MREDLIDRIFVGDTLEVLKTFPDEFVDCVITSPPYWGLRDYGVEGQIGQERTPEEYVEKLVTIFREVKRVLKKNGTFWLNLGDSYNSHSTGKGNVGGIEGRRKNKIDNTANTHRGKTGLKDKELAGIPWRVAFALQNDGWILRQDIIWAKSNPMPESVTDRCTRSHEYIFLLSKSPNYYFDNEAIREEPERVSIRNATPKEKLLQRTEAGSAYNTSFSKDKITFGRNKRDVWWVSTKPFKGAHFATFPKDLVEPMILAGCPEFICKKCGKPRERIIEIIPNPERSQEGRTHSLEEQRMRKSPVPEKGWQSERREVGWTDCGCNAGFESGIVLDPFMGAGTTAVVAKKLGRHYIGIELNPEYVKIANERIAMEVNNEINF
jgi:DNA modification methylase